MTKGGGQLAAHLTAPPLAPASRAPGIISITLHGAPKRSASVPD
ncbi:hypothetical protein [Denitromonas sp.]